MRLFTCIYLSDDAIDHLELAISGLGDLNTQEPVTFTPQHSGGHRRRGSESRHSGDQRLRWVPREQRHLTLSFHGEVPEGAVPDYVDFLNAAAVEVEPFEVSLSGGGSFSGRTLFTGVADGLDEVRALAVITEDAAAQAGFRPDQRAGGRPHLTLARAGARRGGFPLDAWAHALALYRGPLFSVDMIHVVHSELGKGRAGGPLHHTVAAIPLGRYNPTTVIMRDNTSTANA